MWVSKGGQYKTCRNVITFAQDLNNLCKSLPRLPEELDVLIVQTWHTGSVDIQGFLRSEIQGPSLAPLPEGAQPVLLPDRPTTDR